MRVSKALLMAGISDIKGQQEYTTAGTFTFTVPAGVTSISLVAIGGGAGTDTNVNGIGASFGGGGGGGVAYKNALTVTPGATYTVVVGNSGSAGLNGSNSTISGTGLSLVAGGGTVTGRSAASSGGDVNNYGNVATYNASPSAGYFTAGAGGYAVYGSETRTSRVAESNVSGSDGGAITVSSVFYANSKSGKTFQPSAILYGSTGAFGGYGIGGNVLVSAGTLNSGAGTRGAVRIIWGTGRSYPSNALSV